MKKIVMLMLVLASFSSYAGKGTGKIMQIIAHTSPGGHGVVMFSTENNTSKATCSTEINEWAISLASEQGRAMYSLVLSAQAQGKNVMVYGNGKCDAWRDRESITWIMLQP